MESFIRGIPKAELHIHIEGSLEPEMMFEMAERNGVDLPFGSVEEVRAAYQFTDLQSFLDIYYAGAAVLQTEDDFADLMGAYLSRAAADGVRRAEVFFDPQTHTERGVDIGVVINGFVRAQQLAEPAVSSSLILCFLRHLPESAALEVLEQAVPYLDHIDGVGLDSSEVGNPPELFAGAYRRAVELGLTPVAHAGEEGPPEYVWSALDVLGARRIDHGVNSAGDAELVARLAAEQVPLTMCPLSNKKLQVTPDLRDHRLKWFMDNGVMVTINSDDPSYFGGYVGDNYLAIAEALELSRDDVIQLARNSIVATFLGDAEKSALLAEIDEFVAAN